MTQRKGTPDWKQSGPHWLYIHDKWKHPKPTIPWRKLTRQDIQPVYSVCYLLQQILWPSRYFETILSGVAVDVSLCCIAQSLDYDVLNRGIYYKMERGKKTLKNIIFSKKKPMSYFWNSLLRILALFSYHMCEIVQTDWKNYIDNMDMEEI